MSWINDYREQLERMKQSQVELEARNRLIAEKGEEIFGDLWNEIMARIGEAKTKGLPNLITNGSPLERKIIIPVILKPNPHSSNPKEVTIRLAKDKLAIIVSGDTTPIHLLLDLGEDNVVYIKQGGEHRSIQETAKSILVPLLFPEFEQK